jgi:hypothetical protein
MDKLIGMAVFIIFGLYAINSYNEKQELKIKYQVLEQQHEQQTIYFNGYKEGNTSN